MRKLPPPWATSYAEWCQTRTLPSPWATSYAEWCETSPSPARHSHGRETASERAGLIRRAADPRDRRARIPQLTAAGETVRSSVADASEQVEDAALSRFSDDQVALLRRMLVEIIGASNDPGSCL